MAKQKPQNTREFAEISGVGKTKLDKYSEEFLSVLQAA
jgi:superfamily II DNA helicase RecQ